MHAGLLRQLQNPMYPSGISLALVWRGGYMPKDPFSTLQESLSNLSKSAVSINAATQRMNQAVEQVNSALKKLNLGISCWRSFSSWDDNSYSESEDIGYDKIDDKWGIGIRSVWEHVSDPENPHVKGPWHFADAPRDLRIRSMKYLPLLIEKLNEQAEETTRKIEKEIGNAEQLAAAIMGVAEESSKVRAQLKQSTGGR